MRTHSKRLLSLLMSVAVAITAATPLLYSFTASAADFTEEAYKLDFKDYSVTEDAGKGTTDTRWSTVDDTSAEGGRYLKYSYQNAAWQAGLAIKLKSHAGSAIKLANNAYYRFTVRYKVENYIQEWSQAKMGLAVSHAAWGNNGGCLTPNKVMLIDELENTDGWVTKSFAVKMPEKYTYESGGAVADNAAQLVLYLHSYDSSGAYKNGSYGADFAISFDYINIDRVSEVRINNVSDNSVQKIYGAPGEAVSLPSGNDYYTDYNSESGELSGKIDTASKKFSAVDGEDIYYRAAVWESESYNFDFSDHEAGLYDNSGWCKYTVIEDSTATGGKYLKYKQSSITWAPSGATKLTAAALTAGRTYRVTVKYSVSGYEQKWGGKPGFGITHNAWGSLTESGEKDLIILKNTVENTDGFVTESFDVTLDELQSKSPSLMLYVFSHGEDGKHSNGSYGDDFEICFDYIKIERASEVKLYSNGKLFKSVSIVPGETLETANFAKPTRSGYDFLGWFTDVDCKYSATAVEGKADDLSATLYAGWKEKEGTTAIKFVTNGAAAIDDLRGTPGEKADLPTPVCDGKTFSGWYSDEALTRSASTAKFPETGKTLTLYAAWDLKQSWAKIDFEDAPFLKTGWWGQAYKTDFMSITDEKPYGDEKSLKYDYKGGTAKNTDATSSVILYKDNSHLVLEKDKSYSVSFWYNAEKLNSDVSISPMVSYERNWWASAKNYSSNGYVIKQSDEGKGWKKVTMVFTCDYDNAKNSLYFRINPTADVDTVIYFDDITVDPLSDSEAVITLVYDSLNNEMLTVEKNKPITLPVPEKAGYAFDGWYTDSGYTSLIADNNYTPTATCNIYAKWRLSSVICDFENYPKAWIGATNGFRISDNAGMSLSSEEHVSGKTALHYYYNAETSTNSTTGYAQIYNVNDITVIGDTPTVLEDNASYMIKFRYKVNSASGNVAVSFRTAARKNYWGYNVKQAEYTVAASKAGKGWQEAVVFFTTGELKRDTWTQGDALFLSVVGASPLTDLYIDDVELESMNGKTYIEFKSAIGGNSEYIIGDTGSKIDFPENPVREGYTFDGWYTDSACTDKFTGDIFGTESITLYPKMNMNDVVKISFEDDFYNTSLKQFTNDSCQISDKRSTDGKKSLLIDKVGQTRNNAGIICVAGEAPITVEDGATYVLTYDYYVEKDTGTQLDFYTPWPNVQIAQSDNYWAGKFIPDETWRFPNNEQPDIWKTGSFMFTVELQAENANTLFFTCNCTQDGIYYFDNLRLSKIDKTDGKYGLNLNPTGATDIKGNKLYGGVEKGDTVQLPTNLVREGYVFTGWYEDTGCSEKVNNSYIMPDSDKTLYAGWAIRRVNQDFEDLWDIYHEEYYDISYKQFDLDYELSKRDAHSGLVSLHRKGKDYYNATFQVISQNLKCMLSVNQVYKLTMWVKMDKYSHLDGAVSIASGNGIMYGWNTDGDWKNVCAIKDLKDGEWHKLTYTFYSTGNYLCVKTPGECSLWIDDISIELIEGADASICSTPVEATEYVGVYPVDKLLSVAGMELMDSRFKGLETAVAQKLTETDDGEDDFDYSDEDEYDEDEYEEEEEETSASSGKKKYYKVVKKRKKSSGGTDYTLWIIIGAAVLAVGAGAATAVILVKRKKKRGENNA